MPVQDDAGSAWTLPLAVVLPPPSSSPPQPAASSAKTPTTRTSKPSSPRFFKSPPRAVRTIPQRAAAAWIVEERDETRRDNRYGAGNPWFPREPPPPHDEVAGSIGLRREPGPAFASGRFTLYGHQRRRARPRGERFAPSMVLGRSGGTGRRAGLKIRWPRGRAGSIPAFGMQRALPRRTVTAGRSLASRILRL